MSGIATLNASFTKLEHAHQFLQDVQRCFVVLASRSEGHDKGYFRYDIRVNVDNFDKELLVEQVLYRNKNLSIILVDSFEGAFSYAKHTLCTPIKAACVKGVTE